MFGQTPVDGSWAWLLVVAPHTTTPFDLAQTIGTSLFVIGVCLGVVGPGRRPAGTRVAIVFGAGTMTLTLYSLHVVMRTERSGRRRCPSRSAGTSWCWWASAPRSSPSAGAARWRQVVRSCRDVSGAALGSRAPDRTDDSRPFPHRADPVAATLPSGKREGHRCRTPRLLLSAATATALATTALTVAPRPAARPPRRPETYACTFPVVGAVDVPLEVEVPKLPAEVPTGVTVPATRRDAAMTYLLSTTSSTSLL